jgi:hypothetical protein
MAFGSHTWTTFYASGLDSADVVTGPYLQAGHLVLELVGVSVLGALGVRVWRWWRFPVPQGARGEAAVRARFVVSSYAQLAALLVLVFCGPVFSPQYLIWFAPVLVIAVGEGFLVSETLVWLIACALTTLEFPYLWDRIRATQPQALAVLTLRDAVLVALLAMCLRQLWRRTRSAPVPAAARSPLQRGQRAASGS